MRLKAPSDTPAVTSDFAFQKLQDLALKEIAEALTVCFFTLHWHRRWTRGERSELRGTRIRLSRSRHGAFLGASEAGRLMFQRVYHCDLTGAGP